MDDKATPRAYEAPQVVDYGDLQELTAACLGGSGGDAGYPAEIAGYTAGPSNPAAGCKSNP
ncbi:MAG: lasso RiPP family leader peptide-containing protein [Solirubrobacteraceae bacterium]